MASSSCKSHGSIAVCAIALALLAGLGLRTSVAAAAGASAAIHLRVVGGLAGLNQYTRHEQPFWVSELPRISGGRLSAEIVPFDKIGIRPQDMLRLVQLGTVPFGTTLLAMSDARDPELFGPDLAGLNPDIGSMRRSALAFRPHLEQLLRKRYGAELLALYIYPAQETFCVREVKGLADLKGRRVRVSNASQADFMAALGALPVQTTFAEIAPALRSGSIDCAVTGTMSGNTIGLPDLSRYLHTMPLGWGLAAFVANGAAWQNLPPNDRTLLLKELARIERDIWAESARQTGDGIACNVGAASCADGRSGAMAEVRVSADDEALRRKVVTERVIPGWTRRCGPPCVDLWNSTIEPATRAPAR